MSLSNKSPTMTRSSAAQKEQMKTGNRTAFVALPKSMKAKRATNNDVINKHIKSGIQVALQSGDSNFVVAFDLQQPVLTLSALHTGRGAEDASTEEAGNLYTTIQLSIGSRFMLLENLWMERGFHNGRLGPWRIWCGLPVPQILVVSHCTLSSLGLMDLLAVVFDPRSPQRSQCSALPVSFSLALRSVPEPSFPWYCHMLSLYIRGRVSAWTRRSLISLRSPTRRGFITWPCLVYGP